MTMMLDLDIDAFNCAFVGLNSMYEIVRGRWLSSIRATRTGSQIGDRLLLITTRGTEGNTPPEKDAISDAIST